MIGAAICVGLAVAFAVVAALTHGRGGVGVIAFGLAALVFVGYLLLSGRDFTTCDRNGIRCRAVGKYHRWSWSEIGDIEVRTYQVRGVPRSVVSVVLTDGNRVGLTVPIHGGATKDPAFVDKVEQIREYWHRNREAAGQPIPPADDTESEPDKPEHRA
jgi:hypothetical protein